ncbi:hypothetical protein BAL199_14807 [alpha proteobacterium BAL199]|nr:hypothetical protein BAL199_14807 [alpha proteobacterium BAL199]
MDRTAGGSNQQFNGVWAPLTLEHAEWLALLLEQEATLRRQKRFESRARAARLRHDASVEDVDYRAAR